MGKLGSGGGTTRGDYARQGLSLTDMAEKARSLERERGRGEKEKARRRTHLYTSSDDNAGRTTANYCCRMRSSPPQLPTPVLVCT